MLSIPFLRCLTGGYSIQGNHLGLPEATLVTWVMAWTMTCVLIGLRKPFALPFGKHLPVAFYRHSATRAFRLVPLRLMSSPLLRCTLPHSDVHGPHSITPDAFQYLLDKRESRQAITLFLDQASCLIINFYLEADEEPAADGAYAGEELRLSHSATIFSCSVSPAR